MTKKMNLLITSVDSFPRMGGVSTLAYEVTQALGSKGCECVYVGPRGTHFGNRPTRFRVYEDWESDPKLRAGEGATLEDERIFDLFRKILDAYSLHAAVALHPFYYGPAAVQSARFLDLPSAVMVHGTELTSQFPGAIDGDVHQSALGYGNSLADRLSNTLRSSDVVLSNSSFTAKIAEHIRPNINSKVIGCGISERMLSHLESRTPVYQAKLKVRRRERLGLDRGTLIAYVGRLVAHKNLFKLIDIGASTGFQVLIMGNGPLKEDLEEYARFTGAMVTFETDADDERKWQILEAADFGYLMSGYDAKTGGFEGFGISMLEYCAAGAVCLTEGTHGMSDFAQSEITTFNPFNETKEIDYCRIQEVGQDERLMGSIVENARISIREDYTWERVADKIVGSFL